MVQFLKSFCVPVSELDYWRNDSQNYKEVDKADYSKDEFVTDKGEFSIENDFEMFGVVIGRPFDWLIIDSLIFFQEKVEEKEEQVDPKSNENTYFSVIVGQEEDVNPLFQCIGNDENQNIEGNVAILPEENIDDNPNNYENSKWKDSHKDPRQFCAIGIVLHFFVVYFHHWYFIPLLLLFLLLLWLVCLFWGKKHDCSFGEEEQVRILCLKELDAKDDSYQQNCIKYHDCWFVLFYKKSE